MDGLFKSFSKIPMPLALLIVCTLAYGLLIPWLGFFLDDWYIVYFQKLFGAENFNIFFQGDRPFFTYVYQVFTPIFRDSILGWQLFALFAHTLVSVCFWYLLTILMPGQKKLAAITALFFAVYPGFQFHWFSVQYSQAFMLFAIYLLSFILMVEAVRKEHGKIVLLLLSLVCLVVGIFPLENFIGLELVRPVILLVLISRAENTRAQRFKKAFLYWLPYLFVQLGFVIFRVSNSELYGYPVKILAEFQVSPLPTVSRLVGEVFRSTIDSTLTTWINLLLIFKRNMLSTSSVLMVVLILVGAVFSFLVLKDRKGEGEETSRHHWIMIVALLGTVTAMIPFVAGSFDVTLEFPNNRYLISLAPGASLFLAALIDRFLRSNKLKIITCSLLIGLAIGSQFMVARSFMLFWKQQQDFFWQLTWRVPAMKENTLLITYDLPFSKYFSGSSLTAPLNIIYPGSTGTHQIPYKIILYTQQRSDIKTLSADQPIDLSFRSFDFHGSTSAMIVLEKSGEGCLHILSPSDPPDRFANDLGHAFWYSAIPLSDPDLILMDPARPAVPPQRYFGVENRDQWCYFYEIADLARQGQQWGQTVDIYREAQAAGFKPQLESEWLPLLEAYLRLDQLENALDVTRNIKDPDPINTLAFCSLWKESGFDPNIVDEVMISLNCRDK